MLTPIDIHNKEFTKGFRGYNETEVDEFLDQIVNDYEKLCRTNEELKERIARSERDVEQYKRLENSLQDTLLVAQRTAEEVTSAARKFALETRESVAKECQNMKLRSELEAQKCVETAELKAKKILEEAELAARRNTEEAERAAKHNMDEAMAKVRVIVSEYDRLVRDKNKFLVTVRATLESELSILDHTIAGLPHPDEANPSASVQNTEQAAIPQTVESTQSDIQPEDPDGNEDLKKKEQPESAGGSV